MYQQYYGLRELPFELTPNPRYLFLTSRHREALSNLEYGLSAAKALTLLIGEAGTGKTTLLEAVLGSELCRNVRCVVLRNPALTRAEFIESVACELALGGSAAVSKAGLLAALEPALRERRLAGEIVALVVDEAQSLSDELLEEIRLLANIETATEKLLPVVLVGQPELANRLNQSNLRQLKQRVVLRCEVTSFDLKETAAYIATRIRLAGGEAARLFTRDAVVAIYEHSRGIPRTISVICDNALVTGFAIGQQPIERQTILEVCRDFDLESQAAPDNSDIAKKTADPPSPSPALHQDSSRAVDNTEPGTARHNRRLFGVRL